MPPLAAAERGDRWRRRPRTARETPTVRVRQVSTTVIYARLIVAVIPDLPRQWPLRRAAPRTRSSRPGGVVAVGACIAIQSGSFRDRL